LLNDCYFEIQIFGLIAGRSYATHVTALPHLNLWVTGDLIYYSDTGLLFDAATPI